MQASRQLAAIMFTDMVGYTALMQTNEKDALTKKERHKVVFENAIPRFHGKILQHYGDGTLSIFTSAIDGVNCAIEIQQQLQKEPKVSLRIGIHTGDIVLDDDGIYGDGVNLASRIESLAVPGGIFISEKVYDDVKNQDHVLTKELGFFELKNVKQPVRVFAIVNEGLAIPTREEIKGKTTPPSNRLAVLPFASLSTDPENEYFSDGITEELLNALTKVDGLQVTSRTSSFAFKGKNEDVREIATRLNVDKVLEGSVRKSGSRVRITAQLINAADGYHVWSETFDRNLTDIFEVQDEISHIICNKLRESLTLKQKEEQLVKAPTRNLEAYTLYLKGGHFMSKLTPADMLRGIQYMEEAIALEPTFAQPYAHIAGSYSYLGSTGQVQPEKAFEIVHRYSDKAIQLDDSLAEGYTSKAAALFLADWKWEEAEKYLQKALERNPASPYTQYCSGMYYHMMGNNKKAIEVFENALLADPLSPLVLSALQETYFHERRYDDSIRTADRMLEMHPNMRIALEEKGFCLAMKGEWDKAFELFHEVYRLTNHPLKGVTPLAWAYGKIGQKEKSLEYIRKIEQRQKEEPGSAMEVDLALAWWAYGDGNKSFDYIFRALDKRMPIGNFVLFSPLWDGIRYDARCDKIRKRMNL